MLYYKQKSTPMTKYTDHKKFKSAKTSAEKLLKNPSKLKTLFENVVGKIGSIEEGKVKAGGFFARLKTSVRLSKAYTSGAYRELSIKTIIMLVAGLVYFIMPLDIIPDFIPVAGYLDDATIVLWIFSKFNKEIDAFEEWERQTAKSIQ